MARSRLCRTDGRGGRTELARAIFGADSIDSGTLKLNGNETVIKDISDAIQQGISYLTEDRKRRAGAEFIC